MGYDARMTPGTPKPTGFVYHTDCERHEPGAYHPERPNRLRWIHRRLEESGLWSEHDVIEPGELLPLDMVRQRIELKDGSYRTVGRPGETSAPPNVLLDFGAPDRRGR